MGRSVIKRFSVLKFILEKVQVRILADGGEQLRPWERGWAASTSREDAESDIIYERQI